MPFFKELIENKKKNVTLQVQIPFIKYRIPVKRASSTVLNFRIRGSLTIEAAMALPIFLFFMVILMLPMRLLNEGRHIQTALEAAGEEVSQYAYVMDQLKRGEKLEVTGVDGFTEDFSGILTEKGILLYIEKRVEGRVDFKQLESVSFAHSSVLCEGETIDLIMNYRLRLPFSVFGLDSIPMTARSCRRAWLGRKGENSKCGSQDELVYVGKYSKRYHKNRNCHYLYNDIQQISIKDVGTIRNTFGRKYKPCSICGRFAGENSSVYIMPGGERYHSDRNCPSIQAYVKAVPLSEVRHLGACSYCSQ